MAKPPDISSVHSTKNGASGAGEILIECTQIGSSVRVAAIDVATGTEITFQAPLGTGRATIERITKDKLKYVMAKGKR